MGRSGERVTSGAVLFVRFILVLASFYLVATVVMHITGVRILFVHGESMEPTFSEGDCLIASSPRGTDSLAGHPVCWVRLDSGENVIKRLIGYPGQTVHLLNGDTYVDGYCVMHIGELESLDNRIFSLGTDEYLFLGDNRDNSLDGRAWNPPYVHFDNIKGVVRNSTLSGG